MSVATPIAMPINENHEIIDNKLRIYPEPTNVSPEKFWFRFTIFI